MMAQPSPGTRWRLPRIRMSIRVSMALILVLAGGLGWLTRRAHVQHEAVSTVHRLGGTVSYDFQQVGPGGLWNSAIKDPPPRILQRLLPREYFQEVTFVTLRGPLVTDQALDSIAGLDKLEYLDLGDSQITDAGLARIRGLRRLKYLCIDGTRVTDAGLAHLREMRNLQHLMLDRTVISDAGLSQLRSHRLMSYGLESTRVTPQGREAFKQVIAENWKSGR